MGSSSKLALIIVTKDRPDEIRRLLSSLRRQTRRPDLVVIVDAGTPPLTEDLYGAADLAVRYIRCLPPSTARQRNQGLKEVRTGFDFIGFTDDDAVFEERAVERMMTFWSSAGPNVGGAAFNLVNHPPLHLEALKKAALTERLGLYSRVPGVVAPSGFHAMIGFVEKTIYTDWIPGVAVWRREVFERFRYDEWFRGYSYLEDLDFSFRVGRQFRMAVVGPARYHHLQAPDGRGNDYEFGRREVLNRFHFVAKHAELSPRACLMAIGMRLGISLAAMLRRRRTSFGVRAFGNVIGLAERLILGRELGRGR